MGAPDPLADIRKAVGKFEACSRPEMDRIRNMCQDYRNIKEKSAKDNLGKEIKKTITSKITGCARKFNVDVTAALKDFKTAPDNVKKEFDKASKHIKGLPGNKSCLKLDVTTKGTTMTIKPSFLEK